ncbi:MAG TPA: methyltransferase [Bryobacteraceae bacterium]|nr:methyltransferase [Bryobacteraceae bacterium]
MNLWTLTDLTTPWCIHVVATLRVAHHIEAGHTSIEELATLCGVDRDSLHRVMRHLVEKGVFERPSHSNFALNDVSRGLLEESTLIGLDLNGIGGRMAHAWSTLLPAVRTGRPAYHEVFGRGFWDDLQANPDIAASFDALMGVMGHGVPDPQILVNPADWDSVRTVVDVGGGTGVLLAEILKAHPAVRGILVDLPRVIARSAEVFGAAAVSDRVTAVAQSFFDPLPPGKDVYVLKSVIGDWPDREAQAILARCAEAARPSGRVVVFTSVESQPDASPELLMMVLVGGKGRTLEEFRALARGAGLEISATGRHPSGRGLVECRPV